MKPTPKVLHVIRSEAFGGLELYVDTLIKKLFETGIEMAVYCMPNSIISGRLASAGIHIIEAKQNSKYNFSDILAIRRLVQKEGFTAIHSHTNVDAWSCAIALTGIKKVKHFFSLYMSTIAKRDPLHWFIYKRIDVLLSTSENINVEVKHNYPIDPKKVRLLRYGRDVHAYVSDSTKRNDIRNQLGVTETQTIVGTMCRIDPTKGVKEFAEAFLFLPDSIKQRVVFWIIGERTVLHKDPQGTIVYEQGSDASYKWLELFILEYKLEQQIRLIPFQKDLQGYLSAMDIFVLASWNEMYALAVLDALLMKLPVIGTNTGGTPEQLAYKRGMTVSPKSPQEIATAIQYLVENPEKAKEMGARGREWVLKEHDWQRVLPQYLEYYQVL